MKQNFVRLSTRAKTVSLRTLALVMGLVMLLSAVGVGSTLSAFALTNDGSGDQAASLSAAADLGTGIADTATQLKPTLPAYANASLRGDKEDLADTGASIELAATGYTDIYLYYTTSTSGTWSSASVVKFGSGGSGSTSVSLAANTTYRFIVTSGTSNADWWGNNTFDLSSSTPKTNNLGKYYNFYANSSQISSNPNRLTTSTAGLYSFDVNLSTGSCIVAGGTPGGGGDTPSGDDSGEVIDNADLIAVLKREKIMFYHGDEWGTDTNKKLYTEANNGGTLVSDKAYVTTFNTKCYVTLACVPGETSYYMTNSSTFGGYQITPTAGSYYCIFNDTGENGGFHSVPSPAKVTWTTSEASVLSTATTCNISASASGKVGQDLTLGSVEYFYTTNGTNFYTFNPSNLSGMGLTAGSTYTIYAAAKDTNGCYVAASSAGTLTVLPALTTPEITIDGKTVTSAQTASTTEKSQVVVTNMSDYDDGTVFKLYKGDEQVDSNRTGTFILSRNTETAGVYKVIATPGASDTTHSNSADSNPVTLTVTKVAAPTAPVLSIDKNYINGDGKITLKIDNFKTADTTGYNTDIYDLEIYKVTDYPDGGPDPDTLADDYTVTTDYNKKFSEESYVDTAIANDDIVFKSNEYAHYKVKAVPKDDTVYSESDYSNAVHVKVIKRQWYSFGEEPFGTGWDKSTNAKGLKKYYQDEIFYEVFTTTTSGTRKFQLTNSDSEVWCPDLDYVGEQSAIATQATAKSLKRFDNTDWSNYPYFTVTGPGTFFLFLDQVSKKIWVRTDLAEINITPKYVDYDIEHDTFEAAADADDTYVTVNTGNVFVKDADSEYTVTAHVENPDYEFIGWYDTEYDAAADPVTTSTTLEVAEAETATYVPVVRQKVPAKHDVHVDKVNGVTVNATWNSRTASNGRYLSNVPAGATVTISGTSEVGNRFKNVVVKSANGETIALTGTVTETKTLSGVTFTMPDSAVTITAKAEEYWGADSGYKIRKANSNLEPNTTNYVEIGAPTVYKSDDNLTHLYCKIKPSDLYATGNTYIALFDGGNNVAWKDEQNKDDKHVSVVYADELSKTYLNIAKSVYNDAGAEYSNISLVNSAFASLIDYILLDVTRTDDNNGVYNYSVKLKDDTTSDVVSFIAKDGALTFKGTTTAQYSTFARYSTVTVENSSNVVQGTRTDFTNFGVGNGVGGYYAGSLTKGETYTFKAVVTDPSVYVKAFNVNGVSVAVLDKPASKPGASATYTCEYKVREDDPAVLEIMPVFFHYNDANCVSFYLEGYDEVIQQDLEWGSTPYVYPYYATQVAGNTSGGADNGHNAFGTYPGQPLVCEGGVYYTQIPLTDFDLADGTETGTNIKGITINNGWYDLVHANIEGWPTGNGNDVYHKQTYDYDDFQKIFVEKNPTNIYYQMKLREDRDNAEVYRKANVTTLSSAQINDIRDNGNGWELLRDKFNRVIDIFGTPLTEVQLGYTPLYVISTGYNANIAGSYGTSWQIYQNKAGTGYSLVTGGDKTSIPPSLLFVSKDANLSNPVYPVNSFTGNSVNGTTINPHDDSAVKYLNLYTSLKNNYTGVPVYVSYEQNDRHTVSNYSSSTDKTMYGAWRLDGRWYYTSAGDEINSNIEIEYLDGAGGYKTDKLIAGYKGKDNLGEHTGSKAYFTGEFDGLTNSGKVVLDKTKNFTMRAEAGDGYEFVGWYIKQDKAYVSMNPTNKTASTATTMRNGSATYVARFKKLTTFNLTVANRNATGVAPDGNTYNGSGAGLVTVYYKFRTSDDWTRVGKADSEDSITIGNTILSQQNLIDYPDFQIRVVLGNTPDGEDSCALYHNLYRNRYVLHSATPNPEYIINAHDLFLKTTIEEQDVYTQKTYSLLFDTYFTEHTYEYVIRYHYRASRLNNAFQTFSVVNTFDANMKKSIVDANDKLTVEFIESVRPTLSNFRQDMVYAENGISRLAGVVSQDGKTTKYDATVTYENINDKNVNITLLLPYQVINRASGTFNFTPVDEQGVVIKDQTEGTILVQLNNGYEKYLTQTGTATDTALGLLTAPASIKDEDKDRIEYFQYWKVTDPAGEEAIRVYNPMFNYRLFDNYRIEPIYGAVEVSNPNAFAAQDQTDISISYLGTTRNQWNNTNQQDYVVSNADADKASDILFNDFELNYAYENRDVKSDNGITKLGVVIEKIGEVQLDSTGSPILDMSYYSAEDNSTAVKSFAESAEDKATGKAGSNSVKNYTINKNLVNNKNRVEFYYNTYNAYGDNDHGDGSWKYKSNVKNNVYRAYTYMIVDGKVIISSKPAYFTMYGEAV